VERRHNRRPLGTGAWGIDGKDKRRQNGSAWGERWPRGGRGRAGCQGRREAVGRGPGDGLRANGGWWFEGERVVAGGRMGVGGSGVRATAAWGGMVAGGSRREGAVIGGEWRLVGRK